MLFFVLVSFFAFSFAGTFTKVGSNRNLGAFIQINNVGSGQFSPSKISNWQYDIRFPLIQPQNSGTCPRNIYNANVVQNGGAWNIYFGGWDGVSSCHDSVSIVVTLDRFSTFGQHYTMIATGSVIHVNNPSALKVNDNTWFIVTTQLQNNMLNKPAISIASNGINWNPNSGGVPSANINVVGYPGWDQADVNGGNVIYFDKQSNVLHLFFIDFKVENQHSVFHAISSNFQTFQYVGISLAEPFKVVNDLKFINGFYLMGLHFNGPNVYYSISKSLTGEFPPSSLLFSHSGVDDQYIVSVGFVVDENSQRLLGALYGAGNVTQLDQNKIFGIWLQKRVLFVNNATVLGVGQASRASGPENVLVLTNSQPVTGQFYLYGEDYVDFSTRGTLIDVSPVVTISPGDIWQYNP